TRSKRDWSSDVCSSDLLKEAGYGNLKFFENGKEAWEYLEAATKNEAFTLEDEVNLMISDIEMPQMDGHHLTDKVKKNEHLNTLPIIIFSSLITRDLFHKGESVGADAQVSKPEIVTLVEKIDQLIL